MNLVAALRAISGPTQRPYREVLEGRMLIEQRSDSGLELR